MKKVRYMIGAAGVLALTPALGAFTPAAHAATTHSAARTSGKTVSLNHHATSATSVCPAQSGKKAHSGSGSNKFSAHAEGILDQLTPCLGFTFASIPHGQAGLKLRVRTYLNGVEKSWGFTGGHITSPPPHHTVFSKTLNTHATRVCDALVLSSNHHKVEYGPVCIDF